MAKRRISRKSSKCPEPLNTLIDIAGAATLRAYVKHKVKKDYAKGEGEASAKAAAIVFGTGAMRRGSAGIINLGGLMGLNSALRDIEKTETAASVPVAQPFVDRASSKPIAKPVKAVPKYTWRQHCEDGAPYGLSPLDYETADEYNDALQAARSATEDEIEVENIEAPLEAPKSMHQATKHLWRKYCSDGSQYGIKPEDYATADDYEDALIRAMGQDEETKRD